MDAWNKRFGKGQLSNSRGGRPEGQFKNPTVSSLKCSYCSTLNHLRPGSENAKGLRCSHCGMTLKSDSPADIGGQRKYMEK